MVAANLLLQGLAEVTDSALDLLFQSCLVHGFEMNGPGSLYFVQGIPKHLGHITIVLLYSDREHAHTNTGEKDTNTEEEECSVCHFFKILVEDTRCNHQKHDQGDLENW